MKNDNTEITSAIKTAAETIQDYADVQDFVNIRPTIGINGETQVAITTSGLVATLPETIIFLGGYCSTLPQTTVTLSPNAVNYIYISRDRDDRHKLIIENRNIVIGVEGETAFNRFMAGKFVTNGSTVTSKILYNIG
jgi:hypothetical protein